MVTQPVNLYDDVTMDESGRNKRYKYYGLSSFSCHHSHNDGESSQVITSHKDSMRYNLTHQQPHLTSLSDSLMCC